MTGACLWASSVTRFIDILSLGQNLESLWLFVKGIFSICQVFIVVNGQRLKNNRAMPFVFFGRSIPPTFLFVYSTTIFNDCKNENIDSLWESNPEQCDQTTRLVFRFLAICKNEN